MRTAEQKAADAARQRAYRAAHPDRIKERNRRRYLAHRGLLCHNCNVALGHFRDDPALLTSAIAYLRREAA